MERFNEPSRASSRKPIKDNRRFEQYLLIKGYSPKTTESFSCNVERLLEWLKEEGIQDIAVGYNDMLGYVQHLQKRGVTQKTVRSYLAGIKIYYDYLQQELGVIEENPARMIRIKGIKRNTLYQLFTPEELDELYRNYQPTGIMKRRNKSIAALLIYQGLKTEEIAKLLVQDIHLREGKVFIAAGRKYNQRELDLKAFQVIDLQEYIHNDRRLILEINRTTSDRLFISSQGAGRTDSVMYKLLKALRKIKPELGNNKQIRASVITNWLKKYNLRKVQYLAGHRYVSSTEKYKANNIEDLQNDISKYFPE